MFCHVWSHFCFLSQGSIWWSRLDPPVQLPHWWDYRHAPLCPTYSWVLVSPPFFPSSFPPPFPSPFSLRLGLTVLFSLNPKLLVLLPQPQSSAGSQPVLPGTMFLMESALGWGGGSSGVVGESLSQGWHWSFCFHFSAVKGSSQRFCFLLFRAQT